MWLPIMHTFSLCLFCRFKACANGIAVWSEWRLGGVWAVLVDPYRLVRRTIRYYEKEKEILFDTFRTLLVTGVALICKLVLQLMNTTEVCVKILSYDVSASV